MNKDIIAKILGVILLICGGFVLVEPITTGEIKDLLIPVFFIGLGLTLIFRKQIKK